MYPGQWTSILVEQQPAEAIRTIAEVGFPGVELSTEHINMIADADDPFVAADEVRETVEDLGIKMPQVHLTISLNVADLDPNARGAAVAVAERDVELSARMGIENGVIHPGGGKHETLEAYHEEKRVRVESFKRLAGYAAERGFNIAIENMMDGARHSQGALGQRSYGAVIPELLELLDDVGAPNVGICLDTGHAWVQGIPMDEAVRQCGDKLIAMHIADNDGSGDQHRTPFFGGIDWEKGVAALRGIGYEGIFNLENPGERGLKPEQMVYRIRYALDITNWLLSRG